MATNKYDFEEIRKCKAARLEGTILNKRTDRIPFWPICRWFPANYANISYSEFFSDYEKQMNAFIKVAEDFDFDGFRPEFGLGLGIVFITALCNYEEMGLMINPFITKNIHEVLQDKWSRWPGCELPVNAAPQVIGGKFMEIEEYKSLIDDPIEFLNEVLLPRACKKFESPGSATYNAAWFMFGYESLKLRRSAEKLFLKLKDLGYPLVPMGMTSVPLDFIADFLRHVTHTLTDLYRFSDVVEKAVEVLIDPLIRTALNTSRISVVGEKFFDIKTTLVFMPLHLNEMLPPRLFEKYYWPSLKEIVDTLVKKELRPLLFLEGDFTPFIRYLLEMPKGKVLVQFEKTDLKKARDILGDHVVLMGGIHPSHYILGTPDTIKEEVKKLLDEMKQVGTFIFVGSSIGGIPDEAKPENLKAAIDAVKKYGAY